MEVAWFLRGRGYERMGLQCWSKFKTLKGQFYQTLEASGGSPPPRMPPFYPIIHYGEIGCPEEYGEGGRWLLPLWTLPLTVLQRKVLLMLLLLLPLLHQLNAWKLGSRA